MHARDMTQTLDSLKGYHHLNRGAVRVSDDVTGTNERIGCVHFGNDQRHILVHTEGGRVIDHDSAKAGNIFCVRT